MKIKRRKLKRGRVEIIPMIDTIVILLIFYMTFSRFAEENKQAVNLPTSQAGEATEVPAGQLIVNIFNKNDVWIAGTKYTAKELTAELTDIKKKNPVYAKMSVLLRGDKAMSYQDLSDVMVACAKANIIDVSFATLQAQGK